METRHTLHRSLRSSGMSSRKHLEVRGRINRARPNKPNVSKGRPRGSRGAEAEKLEDVEDKPNDTDPQNPLEDVSPFPPSDDTKEAKIDSSKVQSTRRSRGCGLNLTLVRGRSLLNLKSRVDWSRNVEEGQEDTPSAVIDDQASSDSSSALPSMSTESASQSLATKLLGNVSARANRLTSTRLSPAGRLRTSPAQSPSPHVKSNLASNSSVGTNTPLSTATGKTCLLVSSTSNTAVANTSAMNNPPSLQTGHAKCSAGAEGDTTVKGGSSVTRPRTIIPDEGKAHRGVGQPTKVAPPIRSTSVPTRRSTGALKCSDPVVDKKVKEWRKSPQGRSTRTNSSSPVTRTRGTVRGRQVKPSLSKPEDINVPITTKDESSIGDDPDVVAVEFDNASAGNQKEECEDGETNGPKRDEADTITKMKTEHDNTPTEPATDKHKTDKNIGLKREENDKAEKEKEAIVKIGQDTIEKKEDDKCDEKNRSEYDWKNNPKDHRKTLGRNEENNVMNVIAKESPINESTDIRKEELKPRGRPKSSSRNKAVIARTVPIRSIKDITRRVSLRGRPTIVEHRAEKSGRSPMDTDSEVEPTPNPNSSLKGTAEEMTIDEIKVPTEPELDIQRHLSTSELSSLQGKGKALNKKDDAKISLVKDIKSQPTDGEHSQSNLEGNLQLKDGTLQVKIETTVQKFNYEQIDKMQPKDDRQSHPTDDKKPMLIEENTKELVVKEKPTVKTVLESIPSLGKQVAHTKWTVTEKRKPGRPAKRCRGVGVTADKKKEMFKAMIEKEVKSVDEKKNRLVKKAESPVTIRNTIGNNEQGHEFGKVVSRRGRGRPRRVLSSTPVKIEGKEEICTKSYENTDIKPAELGQVENIEANPEKLDSCSKKSEPAEPEFSEKELDSGNIVDVETAVVVDPAVHQASLMEPTLEKSEGVLPLIEQESDADEIEIEPAVITMMTIPQDIFSPKRKRGRPVKLKPASSIPGAAMKKCAAVFKQPIGDEDKDKDQRPVSRWKIPPPSPIRTRRLSKESTVSELTMPVFKRCLHDQFAEKIIKDDETVQTISAEHTCINDVPAVGDASGSMEDQVPLKSPSLSAICCDQDSLNDQQLELKLQISDEDDASISYITTGMSILSDDISNREMKCTIEDAASMVKESVLSLALSLDSIEKESDTTSFKATESQEPCINVPTAIQQTTDDAPIWQNKDSPKPTKQAEPLSIPESTLSEVIQEELPLFSKVDDLQVPFHDTDEAEQSDSLSKKPTTDIATKDIPAEDLDAYLEVKLDHLYEVVGGPSKTIMEGSSEDSVYEVREKNMPLLSETISTEPKDYSEKVPSEEESTHLKEDKEVESIFLKERSEDETNLEIPSKSEWCARKVTTGMKIVLKLKRKGSTERGENSAPSTPTLIDQKPVDQKQLKAASASSASIESKEVIKDEASKQPLENSIAEMAATSDLTQAALLIEDWRKKKRRRNEVEMLNVIDRVYSKKRKEEPGEHTADDSEVSGFTSDSTMGAQSTSAADRDPMKSIDDQIDIKTEVEFKSKTDGKVEDKCEFKKEQPSTSSGLPSTSSGLTSSPIQQITTGTLKAEYEQPSSKSTYDQPQKVEKLVIKRRVPSPTKMKTRGKQNRLWYLFAKQSKPTKEFSVEPKTSKEPKAAPTGTLEELKAMCRPCDIRLVDIIELLGVMSGETATVTDEPEDWSLTNNMEMDKESALVTSLLDKTDADTTDSLQRYQGVNKNYTPLKDDASKRSPSPCPNEEGITPIVKKSKLRPGSEFERQYLSFIMPNKVPAPVLDKRKLCGPIEGTVPAMPKPVLTRAPVTARKTMRSGPGKRTQNPLFVPKEDSTNSPKEKGQVSPGISPNGKFVCLHCPYTSNIRSVILEHVYIHTDVVPYACGHCNEAYGSRNGLTIHTKREHPGVSPDIVKNTDICEEDYYVTCDPSKMSFLDSMKSTSPVAGLTDISSNLESVQAQTQPLPCAAWNETCTPKGKPVSLLNPAVLTAQVAATNVGLGTSTGKPSNAATSGVQLVVTTSRPVSTGPIVNVVAQVDATGSTLPIPMAIDCGSGKRVKIPRRPRIPSLLNVDPNQPYYQCRHCTYANNNLLNIKTHVEVQHKGDQCYQCRRCELAFFKDSQTMEKHYTKNHPGERAVYQLQSQFYDVHQNVSDKTGADSHLLAAQNRGQSPLHVIVSADGVTLLGAMEVSPASSVVSPQISPSVMAGSTRSLNSPVPPSHSTPQPVPSPIKQCLTPPPAHGGSSSVVPLQSRVNKLESSKDKAARCILRVPTISPPQRLTAPQKSPAVAHSSHIKICIQSQLHVQNPAASVKSDELPVDVLNLATSNNNATPGLDLSRRSPRQGVPCLAPIVPVLHPKPSPEQVKVAAPVTETPLMVVEMQSPEKRGPTEMDVTEPEDSPLPFKIMNVMSLAGHVDPDLESHLELEVVPHDGEIPEIFTCTRCDASFSELKGITDHIGNEHKLQYWYACPYCPFGCSWGKMLSHISRSHSGEYHEVPLAIIEEEKYFTRKTADLNTSDLQTIQDKELTEPEQNKDKTDTIRCTLPLSGVASSLVSGTDIQKSTGPKTSEIGCGTDDLPTPSRVVEEEDVVIVSEQRKPRPVGQIRPTMVRAPAVKGLRRIVHASSFPKQLIQPVSPITTDKLSPGKTLTTSLDMDCESIDDLPHLVDATEEDDVIVTETHSSVINIAAMDRPLDLHKSKHPPFSQVMVDKPTDLSFSCSSGRQHASFNEPQDLSVPQIRGHVHRQQPGLTTASSSVIQSLPTDLQSPPPAHQSARRSAPHLVIEPIPGSSTQVFEGQQPWGTPIMIAPLPESPKNTLPQQPQPAHSHNRNQDTGVRFDKTSDIPTLSAKIAAPSLPTSSHKAGTMTSASVCGELHRPVSKTMPPLIHITENNANKQPCRPPPPLIHVTSNLSSLSSSAHKTSKPSVIQMAHGGGQSALSSLEMLTKHGVQGSAHHLGLPTPLTSPWGAIDDEVVNEEAMRKAFNVFNLKPRIQMHQGMPPTTVNHQPPLAHFTPTGINKWKQFQSQNRLLIRPQYSVNPFGPYSTATGLPGPRPGSLGMAAAAFQQAHIRRASVNSAHIPMLSQMSSATAAAAAASFMQQRHGAPTQEQQQQQPFIVEKTVNMPCPYCPFEAEDPDTIHNHILTHAPNIEWSCPYCPMPNRMTKTSITKHMQNCHPTSNAVYIPYGVPLNLA